MLMRCFGVGIGLMVLLSAVFAVQNQGTVPVNFIVWSMNIHQGLWEVGLFSLGILFMWIIAFAAGWETRFRNRRELERCRRRVTALENEKESLLSAMKAAGVTQEEITFIEDGKIM